MTEVAKWTGPRLAKDSAEAAALEAGTKLPVLRKPFSLAEAVNNIAEMIDMLDEGAEPTAAFVALFGETRLTLGDEVDRRIDFFFQIDGSLEANRKAREFYDKRVQQLKALGDAAKKCTVGIIEAEPDLPYEGKLGRLATQKNPPSVKLSFGEKDVTPDMIRYLGIPEKYLKVTYEIKTSEVKEALKRGETLPWAEMKTDGKHLRIRTPNAKV